MICPHCHKYFKSPGAAKGGRKSKRKPGPRCICGSFLNADGVCKRCAALGLKHAAGDAKTEGL